MGLALLLTACGAVKAQGVADVTVSYVRSHPEATDCVTLKVSDHAAPEKKTSQSTNLVDATKPSGTLYFGVQQDTGWSETLDIVAELHIGMCDSAAVATQSVTKTLLVNKRVEALLVLQQP